MEAYMSLDALAAQLSLPRPYLRELAWLGRIPCLRVNGRLRFDLAAVRAALVELAKAEGGDHAQR